MDDLEINPLYQAFLLKFRREFDIACRMSYLIVVPHSKTLDDCQIDQHFAAAHILMPSKLLKSHFNPLQAGQCFDTVELDGRRLICKRAGRLQKLSPILCGPDNRPLVARILEEDLAYNTNSREFKTILVDRPLVLGSNQKNFYSINLNNRPTIRSLWLTSPIVEPNNRRRNWSELKSHEDCFAHLEQISSNITQDLESEIKQLQSTYLVLADYLDDAADRLRQVALNYAQKYELAVSCDELQAIEMQQNQQQPLESNQAVKRTISMAVESYIVHLMHGKLMVAVREQCFRQDRKLLEKLGQISRARMTIRQLGARDYFEHFEASDELLHLMRHLPTLASPIAMVSHLLRLVDLLSADLKQSVEFARLLGGTRTTEDNDKLEEEEEEDYGDQQPVSICSDDLIATLVYTLAKARPQNLCSLAKYLDLFGWTATSRDQAAYFTATLQIVIQFVLNSQFDDSQFNNQQLNSSIEPKRSVVKQRQPLATFSDDDDDDQSLETNSDRLASLDCELFADESSFDNQLLE